MIPFPLFRTEIGRARTSFVGETRPRRWRWSRCVLNFKVNFKVNYKIYYKSARKGLAVGCQVPYHAQME